MMKKFENNLVVSEKRVTFAVSNKKYETYEFEIHQYG